MKTNPIENLNGYKEEQINIRSYTTFETKLTYIRKTHNWLPKNNRQNTHTQHKDLSYKTS